MVLIPFLWNSFAMDWYPIHWSLSHTDSIPATAPAARGIRIKNPGWFRQNAGKVANHLAVRTMASCLACGAGLEPSAHTPHTVYMKSLYRVAGQDYCRHDITRVAVVAGIRAGAGSGNIFGQLTGVSDSGRRGEPRSSRPVFGDEGHLLRLRLGQCVNPSAGQRYEHQAVICSGQGG